MELRKNVEINAGDFVKTKGGFMQVCINTTKTSAIMLDIIMGRVTSIPTLNVLDGIEEIRSADDYSTALIFNKYVKEYKEQDDVTVADLWENIRKVTNLVWSEQLYALN